MCFNVGQESMKDLLLSHDQLWLLCPTSYEKPVELIVDLAGYT